MKRTMLASLAAILCLAFSAPLFGCAKRENTLRILNQGDYMPPEVRAGFEKWHLEKTGKKIRVDYAEIDTNENLHSLIAMKREDYDLVCPSDFMQERMISEGLLLEFDRETQEKIKASVDESVLGMVKDSCDSDLSRTAPYLWGTLGIMYDSTAPGPDPGKFRSWSALWSKPDKGRILMKDSARDAYSVALLYANREKLREASDDFADYSSPAYRAALEGIFAGANVSEDEEMREKMRTAKAALEAQRELVRYEVDDGKIELLSSEPGDGRYGLFWSCDAGYMMNAEGREGARGKDFRYLIPDEGGNVWVDVFSMPKHAKNVKAANLFVQYLCEPDVAYACMKFAGSASAVKKAAERYRSELEADSGFFAGTPPEFKEMYVDMMFPSKETLSRCRIMRDLGAGFNRELDEMWLEVTAR